MDKFEFSKGEKENALKSLESHREEIVKINDKINAMEKELPRFPPTGLDLSKTIVENAIATFKERIRNLESEMFFCKIVSMN